MNNELNNVTNNEPNIVNPNMNMNSNNAPLNNPNQNIKKPKHSKLVLIISIIIIIIVAALIAMFVIPRIGLKTITCDYNNVYYGKDHVIIMLKNDTVKKYIRELETPANLDAGGRGLQSTVDLYNGIAGANAKLTQEGDNYHMSIEMNAEAIKTMGTEMFKDTTEKGVLEEMQNEGFKCETK